MKALPEITVSQDNVSTDVAIAERGAVVNHDGSVIEINSSAESENNEVAVVDDERRIENLEDRREEEENRERRSKSKKKHKKHHHKHHHNSSHIRKKRKKRNKEVEVGPIFLWAHKKESEIVKVVCEDYDPHNRLRLVKTGGVWTSKPRSKVLAAAQSRSTVCKYENESQKDTDEESVQGLEKRPKEKPGEKKHVDVNDNSIELIENPFDFVENSFSEVEEEEDRSRIDKALKMIDQDPTIMEEVRITLPAIETGAIKLPEGTTIHQVKTEDTNKRPITTTSPLSPPLSPVNNSLAQCTYGELTITAQQQLQNEPLNLETTGKRTALETRLQEPPFKKKRVVQQPQPTLVNEPVKREWDPLAELKEVLSDPNLSVPDPLLVPRGRLAALVASPATEIPKLLQKPSILPPPPDPDLFAVSLSNLRSILQQTPGFTDERKATDSSQQSNIEHMLWLSYLSSKEMSGVDNELISSVLSILLPNEETVASQPYSYAQQKNQWNDVFYGSNLAPPPYNTTPGYNKTDDCSCASVSPLSPLPSLQQQPSRRTLQKHQQPPRALQPLQKMPQVQRTSLMQQSPPMPSPLPAQSTKQPVCPDIYCNGLPSPCYESCCSKVTSGGCNPYTVMSPNGCNPYAVSPVRCGGPVLKTSCRTYPADGTACCYSSDIGCGYNGQSSVPPMPPKLPVTPHNHGQYNYQTGLLQPQSLSAESSSGSGYGGGGGTDNVGGDQMQCSTTSTDKSQTPQPEARLGADAADKPLYKPKIKVKQHLIDPNTKPRLLNIEGALHLTGANAHDFLSSSLWHPLFGR